MLAAPEKKESKKASEFLTQLRQFTGVSHRFIEAARPAVEKAFAEVPEDRLQDCLDSIWKIAECQVETEASCERSRALARLLEKKQSSLHASLSKLPRHSERIKNSVAVSMTNLFYGLARPSSQKIEC